MGRKAFENYGVAAQDNVEHIVLSGRYAVLKTEEKRIVPDVVSKLELTPLDDVLEIGCGVGSLLIPLSFLAGHITGIDHEGCISKLKSRFPTGDNVTLISGNFLDLEIERKFLKVLIYSVLQLLTDAQELERFVFKAAQLLRTGGRLLIGDIQNTEKYERIERTDLGKKWRAWFDQQRATYRAEHGVAGISDYLKKADYDKQLVTIDDKLLLDLIGKLRKRGFEAYLLPQPAGLPFGLFSDDLLIVR